MYKLVRDNIPNIIKKSGEICHYASIQNDELFEDLLRTKLVEEVNEFLATNSVEELADILVVITELGKLAKVDLTKIHDEKLKTKGGFDKKYVAFFPDPQPELTEEGEYSYGN